MSATGSGGGTRRFRMTTVVLGTGTAIGGRVILAPLLPAIRETLSMSAFTAGFVLSMLTLATALAHYPAGRMADALSHQTLLFGGLVGMAVGICLVATSRSVAWFSVGVLAYGLGMGLYVPGAIIHLSALFPDTRGRILGINSGAAQFGGVAASGLAGAVLALYSWRTAYVPILVLVGLLAVALHSSRRAAYVVGAVSLDLRPTLARLLADRRRQLTVLSAATFVVVMEGGVAFLPTFLRASKAFPSSLSTSAFGGYFVVALMANPLAGELADRYEAHRTAVAWILLALAGIVVLLLDAPRLVVFVGVGLFAAGMGGFWPPFNTYLMDVLTDGGRGSEYGAARTIWVAIGSLGPVLVGFIGDIGGFHTAFATLGGILVCAALLLWAQDSY